MRLFIFHPDMPLPLDDIVARSKVGTKEVTQELASLTGIGFLRKRKAVLTVTPLPKKGVTKTGKPRALPKPRKVKKDVWKLNNSFPVVDTLKSLLIDSGLVTSDQMPALFKSSGNIRLLVLTGILIKAPERQLDVLVVGDKMDRRKFDSAIQKLEAEVGKELRYALFTTEEFKYRIKMYDHLIHDVLKNRHERVIDKLAFHI